ncbi:Hypothetical predicted protein, partial [Mytilus galloprovincialis]
NYENNTLLHGLPFEVKKLDKKSAKVFSKILEEESYPHFESRVMLAGEQGTGKTTIARYLVGKQPTRYRVSTDGIELYSGLSYMDREKNVWLGGRQDFSLDEIIISRSLQQEDKIKKIVISNATPIDQDVLNTPEDVSLSVDRSNLKHESIEPSSFDVTPEGLDSDGVLFTESVMTKYENVHGFETAPVYDGNLSEHLIKRLPDHVSKQKTKTQDKDDNYQTGLQDKISSFESRPGRLVSDGKSSDDLINLNKKFVQDYNTGKESNESSNDIKIREREKQMKKTDGACFEPDSPGNIHIQNVTKPGVIRKLKNFFGITKKVKEVKVSITKETLLQKTSEVGGKKLHDKNVAPIIIWDFGGQDVFYSTHQTFLTYRAIYIIVLDGSRNLDHVDDRLYIENYLPGKTGQKTARGMYIHTFISIEMCKIYFINTTCKCIDHQSYVFY